MKTIGFILSVLIFALYVTSFGIMLSFIPGFEVSATETNEVSLPWYLTIHIIVVGMVVIFKAKDDSFKFYDWFESQLKEKKEDGKEL